MQLVVNDLLITYSRQGSGKTLLLLHGWGDSAQGLHELQAALAKKYDVVSIDLPGFGGSQAPETAWGLDDYAKFVGAFTQKAGIKLYALLGHSNGGAIAVRGLANGSIESEHLVLLASAGVRGEYKGRVKAIRIVAKLGKLITLPLPHRIKRKLQKKVYKTVGSDMLVAEHLQETFKKVVTDDVRADASQLSMPTLLIYGQHDDATPPTWGQKLHEKITGSTLEIIPDAGHFVHKDNQTRVVALVEDFLQ